MGVVLVTVPEGELRVAWPGGVVQLGTLTVKFIAELQGPAPALPVVWIHHCPLPALRAVVGVIEQVPVPEAQPACAAVYDCLILLPVESFTKR